MKILVKKMDGLTLPSRATPDDAAYDIVATSDPIIIGVKFERFVDGINAWQKIDFIEYKTNLFIAPQDELDGDIQSGFGCIQKYHSLIFPRSSISKKNLVLANSIGLVDNGYRGEICFRFKYIIQPEDLVIVPEAGRNRIYCILNPENVYKKGDRIGQIMARPNLDIDFEFVPELTQTVRGSGGFGSTG